MKTNEILKAYGPDYKNMTKRLLQAADIAAELSPGMHIGIKPNLMAPVLANFGATTHPEIVAGIIEYLHEHGFNDIAIYEGSWVGDVTSDAFEYCGFRQLSQEYGVPLFDAQKDTAHTADCAGMELTVCDCVKRIDYLINVPVLKGHGQTKMSCALKNLKGLLPNGEKRRFHACGLHKPIAHLNTYLKPQLIVVDHICGDPDLEDGGNPLVRNCVMVAKDPVLTDAYGAALLGYEVSEIPYIAMAEDLGCGSSDLSKAQIKTLEGTEFEEVPAERRLLSIRYAVEEVESCSACYGMLMGALARLKDEGLLEKLPCRISIGQANRGKTGALGIGLCCADFERSISGCPPKADQIYEELKALLSDEEACRQLTEAEAAAAKGQGIEFI